MKNAILSACLFFPICATLGQNLTFEVASVRPSPPPGPHPFYGPARGGPGTNDPERITWSNAALRAIIMGAYDVQTFQLIAPDWLSSARYDIAAKVPAGATSEQVSVMWQNLLKDRFGLVLHHESKELPVEVMTIAKGGAKLKETADPTIEPFTPDGSRKFDKNGAPEMNGSDKICIARSSTEPDSAANTISPCNSRPTCQASPFRRDSRPHPPTLQASRLRTWPPRSKSSLD